VYLLSKRFIANASTIMCRSDEFASTPEGGVQLYVWADTSLREVVDFIKEADPSCRDRACRFSLALVYPDKTGAMMVKPVARVHSSKRDTADSYTLAHIGWRPADFLSIGIMYPPAR